MIIPLLIGAGAVYLYMKAHPSGAGTGTGTGTSTGTGTGAGTGTGTGVSGSGSPSGPSGSGSPVYNKLNPIGQSIWDVRPSPIFHPSGSGYYKYLGADNPVLHSGGGGPENLGAKPDTAIGVKLPTTQPGWWYESDDEYYGAATKSKVPVTAGGGLGQPADAFRWLGDNFGARQ